MTTINILYFASFRETLDLDHESLELNDNIKSISDLKTLLAERQNKWLDIFNPKNVVLTSINQTMAKNHSMINNNDEIAFFPPVTGG